MGRSLKDKAWKAIGGINACPSVDALVNEGLEWLGNHDCGLLYKNPDGEWAVITGLGDEVTHDIRWWAVALAILAVKERTDGTS